jgi:transposase
MSEPAVAPTAVPTAPRSRDTRRQAWAERLVRFAAAGQTIAQFCAAEGVSVPSFYLWRRRLTTTADAVPEHAAAAPRLLPLRLPHPVPAIELVLPSGAVLRCGPGADEATLTALLRLLGVLPC